MNEIDKLTEIFRHFPGIGPRQAKRFVYYLLTRQNSDLIELSKLVSELKSQVKICQTCFRFFTSQSHICNICSDKNRDSGILMIVSRDVDLESIEKSRSYNGYYFVLGGTVPILEKEPENKIRKIELEKFIVNKIKENRDKNIELKEIILAVSINPEGENTAIYLRSLLKNLVPANVKISTLGRGLSTGTELEYSDADTIKNALRNRG